MHEGIGRIKKFKDPTVGNFKSHSSDHVKSNSSDDDFSSVKLLPSFLLLFSEIQNLQAPFCTIIIFHLVLSVIVFWLEGI